MLKRGASIDEIATEVRARFKYGLRAAYRHATGLTLDQAAERYNESADDAEARTTGPRISEWESWPRGGRRPTTFNLITLAHVFGTEPDRLITHDEEELLDERERRVLRELHAARRASSSPDIHPPTTNAPPAPTDVTGPQQAITAGQPHFLTSPVQGGRATTGLNADNLGSVLMGVADESTSFLEWAEATNVGDLTVEQIHSEIRRIASNYLKVPTLPLFERTRQLRDRVFSLLSGRQKPAHSRDLYSAAGWSLTVLAWMSTDLNNPNAAEGHLRAAWLCAENADQDSLRAWVRATQHTATFWQGDFVRAAQYAKDGLRFATNGTARLFLVSAWAMDLARCGDRESAQGALALAQDAADRIDDNTDEMAGPFACSIGRARSLWSDTLIALGQAADALAFANDAVFAFESTPSSLRNVGSERMVRCQQVKAHLMLDEPDGAWESLRPVLETALEHRMQPLIQRVEEISQMASKSNVSLTAAGRGLQEAAIEFRQNRLPGTL